jgi:hypothetical protein
MIALTKALAGLAICSCSAVTASSSATPVTSAPSSG